MERKKKEILAERKNQKENDRSRSTVVLKGESDTTTC